MSFASREAWIRQFPFYSPSMLGRLHVISSTLNKITQDCKGEDIFHFVDTLHLFDVEGRLTVTEDQAFANLTRAVFQDQAFANLTSGASSAQEKIFLEALRGFLKVFRDRRADIPEHTSTVSETTPSANKRPGSPNFSESGRSDGGDDSFEKLNACNTARSFKTPAPRNTAPTIFQNGRKHTESSLLRTDQDNRMFCQENESLRARLHHAEADIQRLTAERDRLIRYDKSCKKHHQCPKWTQNGFCFLASRGNCPLRHDNPLRCSKMTPEKLEQFHRDEAEKEQIYATRQGNHRTPYPPLGSA